MSLEAIPSATPVPTAGWVKTVRRAATAAFRPRALRGLGMASVIAFALVLVGAPALAPWILAAGTAHYLLVVTLYTFSEGYTNRVHGPFGLPLEPDVDPDQIGPADLRATYLNILRVHEEIRTTLDSNGRVHAGLCDVYTRCGDAVQVAGRMALLGNPLQRYLDDHDPARLDAETRRLEMRASVTSDREASLAYRQASAARKRELDTYGQLQRLYERMKARLELVAATLASVAATTIKLCTVDLETLAMTRESLVEQIDSLGEDLRYLEAAMEDSMAV
ncbi:MAG TPA: hypothetical protein VM734_10065 [Kofleriaceae bacterium]|nr:hypothetical protein [Kofleriaceae bacterium]